jgi:large subunit ribosomal protein L18
MRKSGRSRCRGPPRSRLRRHARLRKKVRGTPDARAWSVKRSSRHILVQLIDDLPAHVGRGVDAGGRRAGVDGDKKAQAAKVGELVADPGPEAGVDRGGVRPRRLHYHGRDRGAGRRAREGGWSSDDSHDRTMEGIV